MQWHETRLGAGAEDGKNQHQPGERGRSVAHLGKRVAAASTGKQSERKQQAERAEARHDDVDVARMPVLGVTVVRDHQRP